MLFKRKERNMFICLKDAVKKYGEGEAAVYALDHADLVIGKGEICAILGPSGSGKSTILNMLGGLDTLDAGELTIEGRSLIGLTPKERTLYRKEEVGFVFQFYNLIRDLTVEENIEVVSDISESPLDLSEVLGALELEQYRRRFPRELSGGQQQRAAIARAMIKNPRLLLCDELTGALDTRSSKKVLQFVEKMNRQYGTTVVIITHNEAIAKMADQIIRIRDGRVENSVFNERKIPADRGGKSQNHFSAGCESQSETAGPKTTPSDRFPADSTGSPRKFSGEQLVREDGQAEKIQAAGHDGARQRLRHRP